MSDSSLLLLLEEVRGKTLRRLEGLTDVQARWVPAGLHNSILWHAGHAYVVVEALAARGLGIEPSIPAGWHEMFSWESRPAEVSPASWPTLAEVVAHLHEQKDRLHAAIAARSIAELNEPCSARPDQSNRYEILHGLHDEACHSGEIWLMRKLQQV